MLSEAYGGRETVESQVFLEWQNGSKRVLKTWKMMKEVVVKISQNR
jgi:hypothetical protein